MILEHLLRVYNTKKVNDNFVMQRTDFLSSKYKEMNTEFITKRSELCVKIQRRKLIFNTKKTMNIKNFFLYGIFLCFSYILYLIIFPVDLHGNTECGCLTG